MSAQVKHSFSTQHFRAAKHFATQAARIESRCVSSAHPAPPSHRAYVTGAVISVVAGLESSINELYLEAVDRNVIFETCWGLKHLQNSRTLDQHISQLRKRIEVDPKQPRIIKTVHGVGYRFEERPDGPA